MAAGEGVAAILRRLEGAHARANRLYFQPIGLLPAGLAPAGSLLLAGGPMAFNALRVWVRPPGGKAQGFDLPLLAVQDWAETRAAKGDLDPKRVLERTSVARPALAGLTLDQPRLMGILNVTPDSFSDGGDFADFASARAHGRLMLAEGADLIDVGGESTRPGAAAVAPEVERERTLAVVADLALAGAVVSIDTRRAALMADAVNAGARIINDVSALSHDPDSLPTAARLKVPVVLMHMLRTPETMQVAPHYDSALLDIYDALAGRVAAAEAAGIERARLVVDPGIGFGKTLLHNLELLQGLALLQGLGCPVLVGVSRKSFLGRLTGNDDPRARLPESLAAGLWAVAQGAQILRVHDVGASRRALAVWGKIGAEAGPRG